MNSFIKSFVFTNLIFLISFYSYCEYLIRERIEPNDVLFESLRFIKYSDNNWVALGDSRPSRNLAKSNFISNWSFGSENLDVVKEKCTYLIREKKAVKYVLLQADPHIFCHNLLSFDSPHYDLVYSLNNSFNNPIKCFSSYHKGKLLKYIESRFSNDLLTSRYFLSKNGSIVEKKQLSWGDLSSEQRTINARHRFFIDQSPVDYWNESRFYELYSNLLQELISNDIIIVMISYPISTEYFNEIKNNKIVNDIKQFFADTALTFDGIYYLDLSSSITNPSLFQDQDHLNSKGTEFFNHILRRNLTELNLI